MVDGKQKPGVMLYFDSIRPALKRLDNEQCGILFRAILDYAEYGAVSDLEPMTGMVFDLLRPKIDRDAEKYVENREQRQHAVYVREAKRRGEQPLPFSEWRSHREQSSDIEPISADIENIGPYPSISPSPTPSPSTSPSVSPSTATSRTGTEAGEATGEGYKGGGEGETQRLYSQWLQLMDSGDKHAAFSVCNELYRLGYDVDVVTRKLSKRAILGEFEH